MAVLLGAGVSEGEVRRAILDGMAEQVGRAFRDAAPAIQQRVGEAATAAIAASPEYASLVGGRLRGELGVIAAEPVLRKVCANIARGARVKVLGSRRVGAQIQAGLRVELLKGDYSEVLIPAGSFTSEGGYDVDWLRWLTLEGDQIIVADYHFEAGFPERSRTGEGVMLPAGSWRVPAEYSGTAADNWLTRALSSIGPDVELILQQEIARNL